MRLTEKETTEMFDNLTKYYSTEKHLEAINKLGQLEDIEDELGIDLIILYKAMKNGVYVKEEPIRFIPAIDLIFEYPYPINFKDCGKTWALTKEETR